MTAHVYLFGIAKEIFGNASVEVEFGDQEAVSVNELKSLLESQQPSLGKIGSYMVAVNNEYADSAYLILEKDEIAIIPPVSGG